MTSAHVTCAVPLHNQNFHETTSSYSLGLLDMDYCRTEHSMSKYINNILTNIAKKYQKRTFAQKGISTFEKCSAKKCVSGIRVTKTYKTDMYNIAHCIYKRSYDFVLLVNIK